MELASGEPVPPDRPVTLINVFEVPAGDADAFIAQWRERAKIMAAAPGFRDTRLHQAASPRARFRFVNVAHWDSREQLEAAQGSRAFQENLRSAIKDARVRFAANPAAYEVVAEFVAD